MDLVIRFDFTSLCHREGVKRPRRSILKTKDPSTRAEGPPSGLGMTDFSPYEGENPAIAGRGV
jgi:hypothetical protein